MAIFDKNYYARMYLVPEHHYKLFEKHLNEEMKNELLQINRKDPKSEKPQINKILESIEQSNVQKKDEILSIDDSGNVTSINDPSVTFSKAASSTPISTTTQTTETTEETPQVSRTYESGASFSESDPSELTRPEVSRTHESGSSFSESDPSAYTRSYDESSSTFSSPNISSRPAFSRLPTTKKSGKLPTILEDEEKQKFKRMHSKEKLDPAEKYLKYKSDFAKKVMRESILDKIRRNPMMKKTKKKDPDEETSQDISDQPSDITHETFQTSATPFIARSLEPDDTIARNAPLPPDDDDYIESAVDPGDVEMTLPSPRGRKRSISFSSPASSTLREPMAAARSRLSSESAVQELSQKRPRVKIIPISSCRQAKTFNRSSVKTRTKTGAKPQFVPPQYVEDFKCRFCEKWFTRKWNYRRHLDRIHGDLIQTTGVPYKERYVKNSSRIKDPIEEKRQFAKWRLL